MYLVHKKMSVYILSIYIDRYPIYLYRSIYLSTQHLREPCARGEKRYRPQA